MLKTHNTYYNFQNDQPEPLTAVNNTKATNTVANTAKTAVNSVKQAVKKSNSSFDNAVNNIKTGGSVKDLFTISADGAKFALLGGGLGLGYALYKHKNWMIYTALSAIAGMGVYNIYKIVKPLKTEKDVK